MARRQHNASLHEQVDALRSSAAEQRRRDCRLRPPPGSFNQLAAVEVVTRRPLCNSLSIIRCKKHEPARAVDMRRSFAASAHNLKHCMASAKQLCPVSTDLGFHKPFSLPFSNCVHLLHLQAEESQAKAAELQSELNEAHKSRAQLSEDLLKVDAKLEFQPFPSICLLQMRSRQNVQQLQGAVSCSPRKRMLGIAATMLTGSHGAIAGQCAADGSQGKPRAHRARGEPRAFRSCFESPL